MQRNYSFRPRIETLEERSVPATIKLVAGNLFISNQVGTLTVTSLGAGQVKIQDGSSSPVVVSGVGTAINITGTNKADAIVVDATNPFAGNVLINGRNGNDTINFKGTIGGNLTVLGGLGNDTFTNNGDAKVLGNFTFSDSLGKNDIDIANNLTVGGNLTATGVRQFYIIPQTSKTLSVLGNLTIAAPTIGPSLDIKIQNGSNLIVGKALTITGNTGDDIFNTFFGVNNPSNAGTIQVGGNTNIHLGEGNNTVVIAPNVAANHNGNFTYTGGAGTDTVIFSNGTLSPVTIAGNATFHLGEGNLNDLTFFEGTILNGNLTATVGNGDSNGIFFQPDSVLNGNVNITLGNGNNNFPLYYVAFGTAPAGTLKLTVGNGNNVLELYNFGTSPLTYAVDLLFGNGNNVVSLLEIPGDVIITGKLIGGTGSNTFNQNLATILPPWLQVNFP